jgi:ABC-2 type transport system ATP-binding protein
MLFVPELTSAAPAAAAVEDKSPRACTAVAGFEKVVKDYPVGVCRRGCLRALDGISFELKPGEVFGLLGPNRAGKTTLVKLLLSLCQPTSGIVTRLGRPGQDRSTLARVGYVHENHAFPRYLTATALLEFYGALSLLPEPVVRERVSKLLAIVGLADRAREPIARFSKGMVQRLGVAQAMINDPELLVLDEPSEGLDLAGRAMVRDLAADQRRKGRTVLLVSHVLGEVEQICDRIGVVVAGKLVFLGKIADLTRARGNGELRSLEQALRELYDKQSPCSSR